MSEQDSHDLPDDDGLMGEATRWFGRMRGPEAKKHKPEFDAWLARGALHRAFYNRAGEIYAMGKFLKEGESDPATGRWRGRKPIFISIAIGLVALTGVSALHFQPSREAAKKAVAAADVSTLLVTREGQILTQTLPDGSTVRMEPQSALRIIYTAKQRGLRLERGRSRFEVAHERRPFIVFAGRGNITARGTVFEVALSHRDRVTVRLLQGKIDVAMPGTSNKSRRVRHLEAGDTVSYGGAVSPASGAVSSTRDTRPGAVVPEARDIREFVEVPLGEVLALANRHHMTIRLMDREAAALKVSGRFRLDDPEKLAAKLARIFNLSVDHAPTGEILLRRPE